MISDYQSDEDFGLLLGIVLNNSCSTKISFLMMIISIIMIFIICIYIYIYR